MAALKNKRQVSPELAEASATPAKSSGVQLGGSMEQVLNKGGNAITNAVGSLAGPAAQLGGLTAGSKMISKNLLDLGEDGPG